MARQNRRFLVWLGASTLICFILSIELIYGSWFQAPGLWNLGIIRNVDWTIDVSNVYTHDGPIRYKRDYYGLRGSYGQPQDISLLVIGNSTTDQRNVSEGETWPDRLGACLKKKGLGVRTANAGVTGQTLNGLANNFDLWFSQIPGLKPRWVLAYFGVTEINLEGREDSDDVRRYYETKQAPSKWANLVKWLKMNSALNTLAVDIRTNLKAWRRGKHPSKPTEQASVGERADQAIDRQLAQTRSQAMALDSQTFLDLKASISSQMQQPLAAFQARLERLNNRIQGFGSTPIFVTQNSAHYRIENGHVWGDVPQYIRLRALAERTMRFCQDRHLQCIDLSADLFLEDGDAYDGAHITSKGSARVADYLCPRLSLP